jgi:hypothetical protein
MSFITGDEMTMEIILVMVDMRGGLAEEMMLKIGEKTVIQKLDYEGIPFSCRHCHKHGHLANQCNLPFHGQKGGHFSSTAKKNQQVSPWMGDHLRKEDYEFTG